MAFFLSATFLFFHGNLSALELKPGYFFDKIHSKSVVEGYNSLVCSSGEANFSAFFNTEITGYLERATNGEQFVEWKTAPIPSGLDKSERITFVWFSGLCANQKCGEPASHSLFFNGRKLLDFTLLNGEDCLWKGNDCELAFNCLKRDRYGDCFGVMCLTVPYSWLNKGKDNLIKVLGSNSKSDNWFALLGFRDSVKYYKNHFIKLGKNNIVIQTKLSKEKYTDKKPVSIDFQMLPSCKLENTSEPIAIQISVSSLNEKAFKAQKTIKTQLSLDKKNQQIPILSTDKLSIGTFKITVAVSSQKILLTKWQASFKNLYPLCHELSQKKRISQDIAPGNTSLLEAEDKKKIKKDKNARISNLPRGTPGKCLGAFGKKASISFKFQGRSLSVIIPGNWQNPGPYYGQSNGKIQVTVDGKLKKQINLLSSPLEVPVFNDLDSGWHNATLELEPENRSFLGVDKFRVGDFPFASFAFRVFGEESYNLNNVRIRATSEDGKIILDKLGRNAISGECLVTGLKPGVYNLEISASGWEPVFLRGMKISREGETVRLPPVWLKRDKRAQANTWGVLSPNRGRSVFIKPGDTFNIHCQGGPNAIVSSATLITKYLKIPLEIVDDNIYRYYYENIIKVKAPEKLPFDLYDLEIEFSYKSSYKWKALAPQAAKVYKKFPDRFYFICFGHIDTWGQRNAEWLKEFSEMINLISPEFILISNGVNWAYISGALAGLREPYFITTGNHSYPNYEAFYGPRVSCFDFGPLRCVNFGNPWSADWTQVDKKFAERPDASIRLINAYEANAPVKELLDKQHINLIHDAHGLGNKNVDWGKTPTRRVGKTNHSGFRLIRMQGDKVMTAKSETPIIFPRTGFLPLAICFNPENNGKNSQVEASIINSYNETFEYAKARFFMPKGEYVANGGTIFQQFDSTEKPVTIVDVLVKILPESKTVLKVKPKVN